MAAYKDVSLNDISHQFLSGEKRVVLDGESLDVFGMQKILSGSGVSVTKNKDVLSRMKESYGLMMDQVGDGVPIYGVNTSFGGQASLIENGGSKKSRIELARKISESIVHTDVSTGPTVPKGVTRLAMAIRGNMLLKGVSGVKVEEVELLVQLINKDLIPKVGMFGGLGASGDLPQNSRVLSVMRQLPGTFVWKKNGFVDARRALRKAGLKPLELDPKAGLGLVNGDNFSTAMAFYIASETMWGLLTQAAVGAMVMEVMNASNRSLHPMVSAVRGHVGQAEVAEMYRRLLEGSRYIRDEMSSVGDMVSGRKVQDVYSLRCVSQFLGVSWEKVKAAFETIEINANSTSDNPLWVVRGMEVPGEVAGQWVSGGNFLAEYMVEVIDGLRKTLTHVVKLTDRHIGKMIDPHENNGLSANLSSSGAVSQCSFKGIQAQAGMFDVYSMFLSMPVSTLFGVHEQNNQDVTSHAMTSGQIGLELLDLTWLALAQGLVAAAQGIDLRGGPEGMAVRTRKVYEWVRERVDFVDEERPLGSEVEVVASLMRGEEFRRLVGM